LLAKWREIDQLVDKMGVAVFDAVAEEAAAPCVRVYKTPGGPHCADVNAVYVVAAGW
jgi:hypothetical protein